MTLTEFLAAMLDEDEAVAREATEGPWVAHGASVDGARHQPVVMGGWDSAGSLQDACKDEDAVHIARHDPARVLREVAAKRAIVGRHVEEYPGGECEHCVEPLPCPDLRDLAAVYADHPDYDEAWRP